MVSVLGNTKTIDSLVSSHVYFPFCQTDLSGAFDLYLISDVSCSDHSLSRVTSTGVIKWSEER